MLDCSVADTAAVAGLHKEDTQTVGGLAAGIPAVEGLVADTLAVVFVDILAVLDLFVLPAAVQRSKV